MTATPPPDAPRPDPGSDPSPETEQLPAASTARARALAVLDEPLDDGGEDLHEQVRRPGMSSSTKALLAVLAAVVVFGLGALLGRATAPDTGPDSEPDVVGVVESVDASGPNGSGQITVRTADGELTVVGTGVGTRAVLPAPGGLAGLAPGAPVLVSAQRNQLGSLDATHVELTEVP